MYAIGLLWLPIVVSAVAVFLLSCIIHMATPWHHGDFRRFPDEDGVMQALRPFGLTRGEYMAPRPAKMSDMKTPEYQAKRNAGPAFQMTVYRSGPMAMGAFMLQWFIYILVISTAVACIGWAAVGHTTITHRIFHLTAFPAWLAYAAALWPASIWFQRPWGTTIRSTIDGLIYAIATGLVFVWLWPVAR